MTPLRPRWLCTKYDWRAVVSLARAGRRCEVIRLMQLMVGGTIRLMIVEELRMMMMLVEMEMGVKMEMGGR